jgi:hypothetical protein
MWADWNFYTTEYLKGDTPLIPEQSWERWEESARNRINHRNVQYATADDVPREVKMYVCFAAEKLFKAEQIEGQTGGGFVKSYSNKAVSKTFSDKIANIDRATNNEISAKASDYIKTPVLQNLFIFGGNL